MPTYGSTDVIFVVILATVTLPWSHTVWKGIVYISKKATRWVLAYTMAVVIIACLQYSTTYNIMKTYGDHALNDVVYRTARRILSATLGAWFGPPSDGDDDATEL